MIQCIRRSRKLSAAIDISIKLSSSKRTLFSHFACTNSFPLRGGTSQYSSGDNHARRCCPLLSYCSWSSSSQMDIRQLPKSNTLSVRVVQVPKRNGSRFGGGGERPAEGPYLEIRLVKPVVVFMYEIFVCRKSMFYR